MARTRQSQKSLECSALSVGGSVSLKMPTISLLDEMSVHVLLASVHALLAMDSLYRDVDAGPSSVSHPADRTEPLGLRGWYSVGCSEDTCLLHIQVFCSHSRLAALSHERWSGPLLELLRSDWTPFSRLLSFSDIRRLCSPSCLHSHVWTEAHFFWHSCVGCDFCRWTACWRSSGPPTPWPASLPCGFLRRHD